jgi:4a-hydroxytetrahydrobiopterin dehydratase
MQILTLNQMGLFKRRCKPCEKGETEAMKKDEIKEYQSLFKINWPVIDGKKMAKEFEFNDFKEAMAFVNQIAKIAEAEQHHPDIHIFYNKVVVELWSHGLKGLSENDFILAVKIEEIKK